MEIIVDGKTYGIDTYCMFLSLFVGHFQTFQKLVLNL